ncbi:50S ribosomal protein L29 [bacterium]|nr:50S ribosomal protein L29 [bacterium]
MKDLREKSPKELVAMRKKLKDELFALKMKNAIRGLKETHKLGEIRVKIARINTVLSSKIAK